MYINLRTIVIKAGQEMVKYIIELKLMNDIAFITLVKIMYDKKFSKLGNRTWFK